MKRSEVRAFVKSGITTLLESFQYGSGRISEWNQDRGNTYPMIWLDEEALIPSVEMKGSLPINSWPIVLHIARKDAADSNPSQYNALIDACDLTAQKLIKNYNDVVEGYKNVTLSNITRPPFIKKNADILTGVRLEFTLISPDTTNLC